MHMSCITDILNYYNRTYNIRNCIRIKMKTNNTNKTITTIACTMIM